MFHNRVVDALGDLTPEERASALEALRTATPQRQGAPQDGAGREPVLDPEALQSLREERREKLRERMQERREQRQQRLNPDE
ncbi:MAG: hypothetical protein R3C16_05555 [Hyphomonadaceae bacterium]